MKYLLGVDQSTSATKVLLFDSDCQVVDSVSIAHQQHYPQPGWVEHDTEEIWANLNQAARQLLDRHAHRTADIGGISITNQRETVVLFQRATGRPVAPAIVWQCRRSDGICQQLLEQGHGGLIEQKTGLKLDAYFSASKIAWLLDQHPELSDQLRAGEVLIGTIDTYLIYRLTGGAVFATEHTNASRTLLFQLAERRWDAQLCELFGVPPIALAEVRESFADFGSTDLDGLLPSPVHIHGVMGDSQASLFAQRCFAPGDTKATFGSGTSVMMNTGSECVAPHRGMVAALGWVWQNQPTYAVEGLINYSAATIAWLKDQLGLIESAAETEELAATVDSSDGVYFVPAFSGMGAPYWRPKARAAIVGMTGYTSKAHLVRAALESIAFQIHDVLDAMRASGVSPKVVHADGGPTRNTLLMQMVADICQLQVVANNAPDNSARGAAMAAMLGLRWIENLKQFSALPLQSSTYEPHLEPAVAEAAIAGWRRAVERVF